MKKEPNHRGNGEDLTTKDTKYTKEIKEFLTTDSTEGHGKCGQGRSGGIRDDQRPTLDGNCVAGENSVAGISDNRKSRHSVPSRAFGWCYPGILWTLLPLCGWCVLR